MIYFLSMLNNEYVKIGYTSGTIDKRISSLQTGNPLKIEVIFTIDGSIKQEKEIHRSLKEVFNRLKIFNHPDNEWYPSDNPIIKMFICNIKNYGITYAMQNISVIFEWDFNVKESEVYSIRGLEKSLRRNGFSRSQAKTLISQKKFELMNNIK